MEINRLIIPVTSLEGPSHVMYRKSTTQFFKIYVMIYIFVKFFSFLYKIIYFDIEAQRKFFNKSHGKDSCDDENGIVKRLVSKALL